MISISMILAAITLLMSAVKTLIYGNDVTFFLVFNNYLFNYYYN